MEELGVDFVGYVSQFGYDKILRVLGRHLRDFLNGLDNLHEYMKFSYPKLKPPSFFIQNETPNGLLLYYRSRRIGYMYYIKGQIRQVLLNVIRMQTCTERSCIVFFPNFLLETTNDFFQGQIQKFSHHYIVNLN